MLDVALFRAHGWGDPRIVRESQRRRRADVRMVDTVLELDSEWRALRASIDEANRVLNGFTKQFKCAGAAGESEREQMRALKASTKLLLSAAQEKHRALEEALRQIGNIVHQDAPYGSTELSASAVPAKSLQAEPTYMTAHALAPALATGGIECAPGKATEGDRVEGSSCSAPGSPQGESSEGSVLALLCATVEEAGFALQSETALESEPSTMECTPQDLQLQGCARTLASATEVISGPSPSRQAATVPAASDEAGQPAPISAQSLPARHAFVLSSVDSLETSGAPREGALLCAVIAPGDPTASWRELERLSDLAVECARLIGLADVHVRDVPAYELPFEAARVYAVYSASAVVARVSNHTDFVARAHGWKLAISRHRDTRTPETRFAHTLTLSFAPAAVLSSLVAGSRRYNT